MLKILTPSVGLRSNEAFLPNREERAIVEGDAFYLVATLPRRDGLLTLRVFFNEPAQDVRI